MVLVWVRVWDTHKSSAVTARPTKQNNHQNTCTERDGNDDNMYNNVSVQIAISNCNDISNSNKDNIISMVITKTIPLLR